MMKSYTQEAEMGKGVLEMLSAMRENLKEEQESLEELKNGAGNESAIKAEQERVLESQRHDRMERKILNILILEEDIQSLEERIGQYEERVRRAFTKMPEIQRKWLEMHYIQGKTWKQCEQSTDRADLTGRLRNQALESFWVTYQIADGHSNLIIKAKECRMWKQYLEQEKKDKGISGKQAGEELKERTGVSPRQAQRLIRLLSLIPEIQEKLASGRLCESAAYHISFIEESCQHQLAAILDYEGITVGVQQAKALRRLTRTDWVHQEKAREILLR